MSQTVNLGVHTARLNEAFVDMGFKLASNRHEAFWRLCIRYSKAEGWRAVDQNQKNNLALTIQDVVEYTAVTFIQYFGESFWPANLAQRGHLSSGAGEVFTGVWDWNAPLHAKTHQNCQNPGANDRTLYQDRLRSPLGSKVKRYFEVLMSFPGFLWPDLGAPSKEEIDGLVRQVLDTSAG